ncbi:MAG: SDR family NAD(P)-dependent oxidoreductase [Planctomycetota bacterium]
MSEIAIIGLGCRFPDANDPQQLWELVVAGRRAFRRIPAERLSIADYAPGRGAEADLDSTYCTHAGLIDGFEFDRVRFRVAGSTFRAADLTHWLALDTAAQALADAGFADGVGLPRAATGVVLGNSLTGEFARAAQMRLRWPYVRRVLEHALEREGRALDERQRFLAEMEAEYKAPFPPPNDESLAGGLSNTIAGRICNHYDFGGGGFTIDGACSSSLLAVAQASAALESRDLDVALAGGVDLSLDPFELVGFARTGALAHDAMRVYDRRPTGFWPGEGCGFVVLMRATDAIAAGRRIYATIRGWGVSSDGAGGLTRPEVAGQERALARAYGRAGFGIDTVSYFEGHGTGTAVGDETELRTLMNARRAARADAAPARIGSIKASIGHTKAAAGVAALIKATLAVHHQVLPPTIGVDEPHALLTAENAALTVNSTTDAWPANAPLRAGASSMGFGGINVHVVLEGVDALRRQRLDAHSELLAHSAQDCELMLLSAPSGAELLHRIEELRAIATRLSRAELADLSAALGRALDPAHAVRAALVTSRPEEFAGQLETLASWISAGVAARLDVDQNIFLGTTGARAARIGYLFPGQGAPLALDGGAHARRFPKSRADLRPEASVKPEGLRSGTAQAQPAIVRASLAALELLDSAGVNATAAIGHSLGELTAFCWGGALAAAQAIEVAHRRGAAMEATARGPGAMAAIEATRAEVARFIDETEERAIDVRIAAHNGSHSTVISGPRLAVEAVVARARAARRAAVPLRVAHAFHSPLVAGAAPALEAAVAELSHAPLQRRVISTVTGDELARDTALWKHLAQQITAPVLFEEALHAVRDEIDLWIEVGPGSMLGALSRGAVPAPVVSVDYGSASLRGFLAAVGAAHAVGAASRAAHVLGRRFTRPFAIEKKWRFFANPCETAPIARDAFAAETIDSDAVRSQLSAAALIEPRIAAPTECVSTDALELVRELVAARSELPASAVLPESRLLDDLHLNSIAIGLIASEAHRRLGLEVPLAPTQYARATVAELAAVLAAMLEEARAGAGPPSARERDAFPPGVDAWARCFEMREVLAPLAGAVNRNTTRPESPSGEWKVATLGEFPLAGALAGRLRAVLPTGGALFCCAAEPAALGSWRAGPVELGIALAAVKTLLSDGATRRVVYVEAGAHGLGYSALLRTLYLERSGLDVCVVRLPQLASAALDDAATKSIDAIVREALAARGWHEVRFDARGQRFVPQLSPLDIFPDDVVQSVQSLVLAKSDVLLVTGGGKGIATECALAFARSSGVALALIGRSRPAEDAELRENLRRFESAGVRARYYAADVCDLDDLRVAVGAANSELGPITAVLHGAGQNVPRLLAELDPGHVRATLAPKIDGLRNLLSVLEPARLRLLINFGSIIARTGMRGEGDYALANDWLRALTIAFAAEQPHCRTLILEWSVWSGVGMGERLGRIESLAAAGISAITPETGCAVLNALVAASTSPIAVAITGRLGAAGTVRMAERELPLGRFLEEPRVYVPGVELVVDAALGTGTDPYLRDHIIDGVAVLPAVVGLEAMAQVTMALQGDDASTPVFEAVRLDQPVTFEGEGVQRIRIAALRRGAQMIEVVLRSSATRYQVDHMRAYCRFANALDSRPDILFAGSPAARDVNGARVGLEPDRDLYGGILFQSGRFQRLKSYRELSARHCIAEIDAAPTVPPRSWFGGYLSRTLVLGDPGARDAVLHSIQACVPDVTLLPVAVKRFVPAHGEGMSGLHRIEARELRREHDRYIYDVTVRDEHGRVIERWEELTFQVVGGSERRGAWLEALVGPYVERTAGDFAAAPGLRVVLERNGAIERGTRSANALKSAGHAGRLEYRADGKPDGANKFVAAAHAGTLTLAVTNDSPVGCDLEPVEERERAEWQSLLGSVHWQMATALANELGESLGCAATRLWCALESLKKVGAPHDTPLTRVPGSASRWVTLRAGRYVIATWITTLRGEERPQALAVLVEAAMQG